VTRLLRAVILLIITVPVLALAQEPISTGISSTKSAPVIPKHPWERGDQYLYGKFFALVNRVDADADEADRAGMSSQYLRNYFQTKAALAPTQVILLNQTARDLAAQLAQYDSKTAELRQQRHVLVQKKRMNGEPIPPVPAQILGPQAGRDALVLQARDRLRLNLGDSEFARLDTYVRAHAPWKEPILPAPDTIPAQKPNAASVPDRVYYITLFRSVAYFKAKAEEERKLGLTKVAESLTTLVQRQAGLTPEQFQILDRVATEYLQAYETSAKQLQAAQLPYKKLVL
jgi:AraC-like DNA-binding protein